MSKMKTGLGRGLDALINPNFQKDTNEPVSVSSSELKEDDGVSNDVLTKIDIKKIVPNPFQPRTEFDSEALDELKNSILTNGLIQPITVRRVNSTYELISGERRMRACKEIGYNEIPAYVIKVDSDEAMLALSLIENIQREQLNAIEIASAYKRLIDECNLSQEDVAEKVGKNRTTVTNTLRLLKLPKEIQAYIVDGKLSQGHARAIINLPNIDLQKRIADKTISKQLSVRKVEQIVKSIITDQKKSSRQESKSAKKSDDLIYVELENKFRGIFGTKVECKQKKDGSGDIRIEFYSNAELERLIELIDIIEQYNS